MPTLKNRFAPDYSSSYKGVSKESLNESEDASSEGEEESPLYSKKLSKTSKASVYGQVSKDSSDGVDKSIGIRYQKTF